MTVRHLRLVHPENKMKTMLTLHMGPLQIIISQIESDEADLAAWGFGCTYGRSKVALCPPAVSYQPFYFFSRYPVETTKLWNLKNLLTPTSWFAYFVTIIIVIFSLKICCYVGRKFGLTTVTEEIALVPFRFLFKV